MILKICSHLSFILKKGCFFKAQLQKITCLIVQVREGRNFTHIVSVAQGEITNK